MIDAFYCSQVNEVVIRFNSKITSTTRSFSSNTMSSATATSSGASQGNIWWWGWQNSAQMSASYSSQSRATRSNTEKREFSLSVEVMAVQDEMPGGMKRVLSLLEQGFITGKKDATA